MQTSYSINIGAVSYPGQLADLGVTDKTTSLAVASAIGYGLLVVRDTGNSTDAQHIAGKLPAASGDITTLGSALGVSIADQARAQDPTVTGPQYPMGTAVSTLRKGRIWVKVESAVVAGQPCFVRFESGASGTQPGSFRADADTDTSAAQLPTATYATSAAANGFAQVELNLV